MYSSNYEYLSAIKTPLIFIVVLSHVHNIYNDLFVVEEMIHITTKSVVPCFFVISGYFFLKEKSLSFELYKSKIHKRIKTLFIPYLIWNILPILLPLILCFATSVLDENLSNFYSFINELNKNNSYDIIKLFWCKTSDVDLFYPANFPMWYIRDLIMVIIVSPILYLCLKYSKFFFLFIFMILFVLNIPFSNVVLFFYFGMLLSYSNINLPFKIDKYDILFYLSSLILLYIVMATSNKFLEKIYIIISIFSWFFLIKRYPQKIISYFSYLSRYSFFIYAAHALYIYRIDKIIYSLTPNTDNIVLQLFSYICVAIVSCLIGILIYHLLRKTSPKLLNIICGSRI